MESETQKGSKKGITVVESQVAGRTRPRVAHAVCVCVSVSV